MLIGIEPPRRREVLGWLNFSLKFYIVRGIPQNSTFGVIRKRIGIKSHVEQSKNPFEIHV